MQESSNTDVSQNTETDLDDIFSLINDLSFENTETKESQLLNSLKPYLNEKRQKKLSQCEKIMSLTATLKTLNDLHVFDSLLKTTDE